MLEPITDKVEVIDLPPGLDMAQTEAAVLETVRTHWQQSPPDVIVIGGWPFFATAAQAEALGTRSIFIDAGAVAQDGIPDLHLPVQLELRRIRQLTLPAIDRVLPISSFIRSSQSEPDRGSHEGLRTVLLGADHMSLGTFPGEAGLTDVSHRIDALIRAGETLILLLGRFERAGYKNSSAAYDLLRDVRQQLPRVRLLILDSGQDCAVPEDLEGAVELLGAPDDHALQYVMRNCAAGVTMSLWEGFNLPLAEMQWLNKPAFAYNIGAHPEVIADPWLLSDSLAEMVAKVCNLLQGNAPTALEARFTAFRQRQSWKITLDKWEDEINELGFPRATVELKDTRKDTRRIVLVDVSSSSMDPANPGVVRVTRRLCSWLQWYPNLELVFAAWHAETASYIFLNEARRRFLEAFGGPKDGLGLLATCGQGLSVGQFLEVLRMGRGTRPVVFMPEVMFDGQAAARAKWARENGYSSAAILYDLIPVLHQELCGPNVTAGFPGYLEALVTLDAVWSISNYTLENFKEYVAESGLPLPSLYEAIELPGQFGRFPRRDGNETGTQNEIRILCISTLEPRKNHLRLLEAFQRLRENRPELPLRLVLIGNRYASAPEIVEEIQAASQRDPSIEWHGIVDDERLALEFSSATFTVYPSLVEGFGLPILESLWMGRPCLTHNDGVMYELAKGGGCIATDMTDVDAIQRELERLATDRDLLIDLIHNGKGRRISTWEEYASELADRLSKL